MDEIDALPTDQRTVLVAMVIAGHRTDEVAERLNIAQGTVLSRLARARARLRTACALGKHSDAISLLPEETGLH